MIAVSKKEKEKEDSKIVESNESLMKRFNRKVLSTGGYKRNKRDYFEKDPTRAQRRGKAIRRSRKLALDTYLIKIGKKEEEPQFGKNRNRKKN